MNSYIYKAYVMAVLKPNADGAYALDGIEVFSEPTPTSSGGRVFAMILEQSGLSFGQARDLALERLRGMWPGLAEAGAESRLRAGVRQVLLEGGGYPDKGGAMFSHPDFYRENDMPQTAMAIERLRELVGGEP